MHASYNPLTLPPLLKLFHLPFYKRGIRGAFLWLRARHNKRGESRARRYRSSRGGTMTNGGLLAIYLLQQQELQDGCLPYINWV